MSEKDLGGFIITADWHCHTWREGGETIQGQHGRLRDFINAMRFMITYAKKHRVPTIWQLGDVFHLKKNIPVEAYNTLWDYLYRETDYNHITFLAGNHDRDDDRTASVTILPFSGIGRVYTTPEILGDTVVVPWLYDQGRARAFIADLPKRDYELLLFHGELDGVEVGPTDYVLPSRMTAELIKPQRFEHVFAGHIHKRQQVKGIWYPGSIIPKDFGELEQDKGFLHVTSKGEVKVVQVPAPCFKVFDLGDGIFESEFQVRKLCEQMTGHFVRILSNRPLEHMVIRRLEEANPRYLDIKPPRAKLLDEPSRPMSKEEGFDTLVHSYVEQKGVPEELATQYIDYGINTLRREG